MRSGDDFDSTDSGEGRVSETPPSGNSNRSQITVFHFGIRPERVTLDPEALREGHADLSGKSFDVFLDAAGSAIMIRYRQQNIRYERLENAYTDIVDRVVAATGR